MSEKRFSLNGGGIKIEGANEDSKKIIEIAEIENKIAYLEDEKLDGWREEINNLKDEIKKIEGVDKENEETEEKLEQLNRDLTKLRREKENLASPSLIRITEKNIQEIEKEIKALKNGGISDETEPKITEPVQESEIKNEESKTATREETEENNEKEIKEDNIENIDDYLSLCKKEGTKLRTEEGGEKTFVITGNLEKGNIILKNTETGSIKEARLNKEFLYEINNVKISKEDLNSLKETIEKNRSLFDGSGINIYAIEGTVNDLLNDNEGVEKIDISDYFAVSRALEIVEKNEELKVEEGVGAGKEYISSALPAILEKSLEFAVSEAEIRDLEEQIEKYKNILSQLENELKSRGGDDFENRKETEDFIDKLERLIGLMSELLELKKQGNQKQEITIKELEIDNLTSELKEIIKKLNKKNNVLRGERKKELNTGGEEEIEEISDLGWNINKLFDGKKDLGADDEKTKEDMLKDIPNASDIAASFDIASSANIENTQKQLEQPLVKHETRTEAEKWDYLEENIKKLLRNKREIIEKIYKKEGKKEIIDLIVKADGIKGFLKKFDLDLNSDNQNKVSELFSLEIDKIIEDAEKEPKKIELNEAEKEYIRKTKEIEKLRKENEGLLSIPWEDLTEEEKEIVERIEELEIGRVVDKGSAIMTNHIDELERKVGTPKEKKGILEAQKEYIESKKLLIGVEMLEKGLRLKMERSKKRRRIFPPVGKFGKAIKNAVKGRLKDPFKKKEEEKTVKAISQTNERFSREKRRDLSLISEQDLTDEFDKVLGDIIDLEDVSNKKTKRIIENVYEINIKEILNKINTRDNIKNDHDGIKANFEEARRRIGELPNDLSNPKEYLNRILSEINDIFKEKIREGADLNYDDYEIIVKSSGELVAWNPKDGDPGVKGSLVKKGFFDNPSEIIKKLLEQEKEVDILDIIFSKDEISKVKNAQNIESLKEIVNNHLFKFDFHKDSNTATKYYHRLLFNLSNILSNCYDSDKKKIDLDEVHKLSIKYLVLDKDYSENANNYFTAALEKLGIKNEVKKEIPKVTDKIESKIKELGETKEGVILAILSVLNEEDFKKVKEEVENGIQKYGIFAKRKKLSNLQKKYPEDYEKYFGKIAEELSKGEVKILDSATVGNVNDGIRLLEKLKK